ncbi:MAG: crotonase/enoyl-CoA hydratase family protein [Pseudomonadota bacterium]
MSERVITTLENHVATVTLSRAEKQNALDMEMFSAIAEAGDALKADRSVRAVVLRADGDHFCAGMDVSVFQSGDIDASMLQALPDSNANFFQKIAYVWREIEVPVICAVKGNCLGGGLQIALGADIRISAADAKLSIMEVHWGLIPDLALTTTLRDIMPVDKVKALMFTGRILSGAEALPLGLVTDLAEDPDATAAELAAAIARMSPDAIRGGKQLVNAAWRLSEAESLRLEAEIQGRVLMSPNTREAAMAKFEKREATFKDA